jgi:hypothetical protein
MSLPRLQAQRQVVVDRLRDVDDADLRGDRRADLRGGVGGVVAPDRHEGGDAELAESAGDVGQRFRRLGRVFPRRPEDRPAVEVDAGDVGDLQLTDVSGVALDEPLVAVVEPEDPQPVVAGLDGGGGDHPVDAGRRAATDEDPERLHSSACRRAGQHPAYRASQLLQRLRLYSTECTIVGRSGATGA